MAVETKSETGHFADLHVLIVDDLYVMREILASICVAIGFRRITSCDTGKEAMHQLQAGTFDLVIVDMRLEGESGLQVVRAIRTIPALALIRVILVTASRDHQAGIAAKAAGADDFLLKPFQPEALRERLLRLFPASLS